MGSKVGRERDLAAIDFLIEKFPKAFSKQRSGIRPLKPDILDDIVRELGAEEFRPAMKRALAFYQVRQHYLKKVVSGKWYRDLHGNRTSQIPPSAKEHAAVKLEKVKESRKRNRERHNAES